MKVFLQTLLFVSIVYFCHVTFFKFPEKSMKTIWYECIYWLCIRVCMNAGAVVVEIICIVQSVHQYLSPLKFEYPTGRGVLDTTM